MVIYANDAYGLYLSLGIQELAKLNNISVTSIAIQYEDDITYTYAAQQIKELENKYIIVLIHNNGGIIGLLTAFKKEGLTGYPYYYLGVDSWLDSSVISQQFGNETQGFIGTLPWNINTLNLNKYNHEMHQIIHQSYNKTTQLLNKWDLYYNSSDYWKERLLINPPRAYVVYAYDVIYTIIELIQYIEDKYGQNALGELLRNNTNSEVIDLLHGIITNDIDFIGASGDISFDNNGDRQNGLFSFGNILNNGSINYFGYFYEKTGRNNTSSDIDNIEAVIDINKIKWPSYFEEKGIIPHSQIIVYDKLLMINKTLSIIMFIIFSICIIIILSAIIFL